MTAVLVAAVASAGCKGFRAVFRPRRAERPANPFAFERVAVLPFLNVSGQTSPECERAIAKMWVLFHAELQRVKGLRVVAPAVVAQAIRREKVAVAGPGEVLALARVLDVDAVIVGAVTSYDPYYKPRVGVALQVYQRRPRARAAPDILALAERGRPFAVVAGRAPAAVLDRIYDSAEGRVDAAVRQFAAKRDAATSAFGTERYLRDMEKYLSFVCHQAIVDLIATERERQRQLEREAEKRGT